MSELVRILARQVAGDLRDAPMRARRRLSPGGRAHRCLNVADLRAGARLALPSAVFDFVDGAANDEVTDESNRRDVAELRIRPRVLVDVSDVNMGTTVLGQPVSVPLLGAPTGLSGLVHREGEFGIAAAIHEAGSLYVLSSMASYSIEELAVRTAGPMWFQLYVWRDRGLVTELLARAHAAGHQALVLTVDVPRSGVRERDKRNGFGIPPRVTLRTLGEAARRPRWSWQFARHPRFSIANVAGSPWGPNDAISLTDYIDSQFDASLTWESVAWLREHWSRRIVVKGILRAEDATQAVRAGADAVIVSNHGGRQLDTATSSIRALPEVVDAVGSDAEVYLDGGIRRGSDILKALALGARACLTGRPFVYGLAVAGQTGAARAMAILTEELRVAMALSGVPSVESIDGSWLDSE